MESGLGASTEACLAFEPLRATSWRGKSFTLPAHGLQHGGRRLREREKNRERERERLQGKLQLHDSLYLNIKSHIPHMRSSDQGRYSGLQELTEVNCNLQDVEDDQKQRQASSVNWRISTSSPIGLAGESYESAAAFIPKCDL